MKIKSFIQNLPKNLPLLLKRAADDYPETVCQAAKNSEGKFVNYSYKDFYNTVNN